MSNAIVFKSFKKRFSKKEIIGDLNFAIPKNRVTLFLGRSGSGKSVSLGSIMGSYKRYKGDIIINNKRRKSWSSHRINSQIGYYTQMDFIGQDITLGEYLKQLSIILGIKRVVIKERIDELTKQFDLHNQLDKKLKDFSWGMKNRVNMIISLLKDPEILIFDEPGANLDSVWRRKIKNILLEHKKRGKTIILVAHNIDEIMDLIDDIVLIDKGKIIYKGLMSQIELFHLMKLTLVNDIINDNNYINFKTQIANHGFKIINENVSDKTLTIDFGQVSKLKINNLMTMLIQNYMFLESIENIATNYDVIYNSLLKSKNIKEYAFYFKTLPGSSIKKLKKILNKNIVNIYDSIGQNGFNENQEEKIRITHSYLEEIISPNIKIIEFANVYDLMIDHFNSSVPLKADEKTKLEIAINELVTKKMLTQFESDTLEIAIYLVHNLYFDLIKRIEFKKMLKRYEKLKAGVKHYNEYKIVKINHLLFESYDFLNEHAFMLYW